MANGPGVADGPPIGFAAPREINSIPIVHESSPTIKNPDMEGRATPLKNNPADEQVAEGLRKTIQNEDDTMTKRLLEAAGIKAPVNQEIKKSQGFFASIWESIKNFFKDLFR